LLLKTVIGSKACTAGFFFWEDGRIQPEFSSLEVALGRMPPSPPPPLDVSDSHHNFDDDLPADLAELFHKASLPDPFGASAAEPDPFQPAVAEAAPPAQAPLPQAPRPQAPQAWPGLLARAATILIATAALVISVVTYLGAPHPPREEAAASTLGLRVERNPPDLLLTWNRNAREIVAARRATLSIRDGRIERDRELDKTTLAGGSFLYTPVNENIQFRLEVYGADDGSVAQSIRVSPGGAR
jgi:hypothetical protein